MATNAGASAGHQLGQIVGNWYEQYVALPLLERVAGHLDLYCDTRFKARTCRGDKVIWTDAEGNDVDYDYVFELGGSDAIRGIPVAFFETFWRRGARHSKDKARDDSGKLLGMRDAFPTARLLGIVAGGDFTEPARELVRSRNINLFYVTKDKVVSSWADHGVVMDYADSLEEVHKRLIVDKVRHQLQQDPGLYEAIAATLFEKVGAAELKAFEDRVAGQIGATPQEYRVFVMDQQAFLFDERTTVDAFLDGPEPALDPADCVRVYAYEVVFGDGDTFARDGLTWADLRSLHHQLDQLVDHMGAVAARDLR